ncbi:hypothetical protein MTO96_001614 [Rhipicephalus appendiculatus]
MALNPFLDRDGVMRVGGRLQYSTEEEEAKHPVILFTLSRACLFTGSIDASCMLESRTRYPLFENAIGLFEEDKQSNRSFDVVFHVRSKAAVPQKSLPPRFLSAE